MPKGNTCQSRWSWIFLLYSRVLSIMTKCPVKVVLFDLLVRSDQKLPFHFQKFFASSPAPARHHSQNDGWFRSKCLWVQFKLQKQGVTLLFKQSCTQGSVIAVQPNLFFCASGFHQLLKTIHYWLLRMLMMFSRFFSLAVCDPSPYSFWPSMRKNPQLIPTTSTSSTKALEKWEDKHVQATWSSSRNLGSLTLPSNQFGWTFGSDAFHFPLVSTSGLGPLCQYNVKDPEFQFFDCVNVNCCSTFLFTCKGKW